LLRVWGYDVGMVVEVLIFKGEKKMVKNFILNITDAAGNAQSIPMIKNDGGQYFQIDKDNKIDANGIDVKLIKEKEVVDFSNDFIGKLRELVTAGSSFSVYATDVSSKVTARIGSESQLEDSDLIKGIETSSLEEHIKKEYTLMINKGTLPPEIKQNIVSFIAMKQSSDVFKGGEIKMASPIIYSKDGLIECDPKKVKDQAVTMIKTSNDLLVKNKEETISRKATGVKTDITQWSQKELDDLKKLKNAINSLASKGGGKEYEEAKKYFTEHNDNFLKITTSLGYNEDNLGYNKKNLDGEKKVLNFDNFIGTFAEGKRFNLLEKINKFVPDENNTSTKIDTKLSQSRGSVRRTVSNIILKK
jgi:hypothetical protein